MAVEMAEVIATLQEPQTCIPLLFLLAVVNGVVYHSGMQTMQRKVKGQPWWPRAIPLQRQLLVNFGFPKEQCDADVCLWGFAFVNVACIHHFICGVSMLPVLFFGWTGVGLIGQLAFISAMLFDASLNIFDEWQMTMRFFFPREFEWLGPEQAKPFFFIMGVLHHPLALCMGVPMILYYAWLPAFHEVAVSLLLAAAVCFLTGSYKFTLDTKTRSGFLQYKAIVLAQLVTIYFSRGYVWFTRVYTLLCRFHADGATGFFAGGCVCGLLMTLFNVVLISDATSAALKWLPRSMPEARVLKEPNPNCLQEPSRGIASENERVARSEKCAALQLRARGETLNTLNEVGTYLER